jgi:uncharacterized membrane protein
MADARTFYRDMGQLWGLGLGVGSLCLGLAKLDDLLTSRWFIPWIGFTLAMLALAAWCTWLERRRDLRRKKKGNYLVS